MKSTCTSNFKHFIWGGVIITLFNLFSINSLIAQKKSLFSIPSKTVEKGFIKETKDYLKTLRATSKSVSFISVENVEEYLEDGQLPFAIDHKDTVTAKVNHWEYYDNAHWQFFGEVQGTQGGSVQINVDDNGAYGYFYLGSRHFEIIYTNNKEVSILVEHHPAKGSCGNHDDRPKVIDGIITERSVNTCDLSKIRVLVAYTSNAYNAVNQNLSVITNRVNDGINLFNNANLISNVNEAKADLELAGIVSTPYYEYNYNSPPPSNNIFSAYFNDLTSATKALKIAYKADVLVLLTGYPNWSDLFGVASQIGATNDDQAYAIVQIAYSDASKTFAHEVGHLLGGAHTTQFQKDNGAYIYDIKACSSCPSTGQKYTIMTGFSDRGSASPANRWSNPDVMDGGAATGVTGSKNVARNIRVNAPIVAGFRESPNSTNAIMSGPLNIYSMGTYAYSIAVGCPEPSSYTWYKSTNGYTWTLAATNTTGISQFFYPGYATTFYVKCVLEYANGTSATYFRTTNVYMNPYRIRNQIVANPIKVNIQPNPSSDEIVIEININKIQSIKFINSYGEPIDLEYDIINTEENKSILRADINHLKEGVYQIILNDGTNLSSSKFVKL